MIPTRGYAAQSQTSPLGPFEFDRREPKPHDVLIDIAYCGVCHSDIHLARNEWGGSMYPIVPGHEIVGQVTAIGSAVTKFKQGDTVGVGCVVDSCRACTNCKEGLQQFCDSGAIFTYNSLERDGVTRTFGGYSTKITVDENYVLAVPTSLPLNAVAPLLCAGITTYSPLRHWEVGKSSHVGIVGLGGLGHMGVKFAAAFGSEVTVISTSKHKAEDAKRLGAHHFLVSTDEEAMTKHAKQFDFILDTVSAQHDLTALLSLVKRDGTLVMVGVPPDAVPLRTFSIISGRKSVAGSLIGGIPETQEMLDFCGKHNIVSDVEMIQMKDINTAYERMIRGDVRYRFVIDSKSI